MLKRKALIEARYEYLETAQRDKETKAAMAAEAQRQVLLFVLFFIFFC
jgi:hypothetical protein